LLSISLFSRLSSVFYKILIKNMKKINPVPIFQKMPIFWPFFVDIRSALCPQRYCFATLSIDCFKA
jgi:hypothetical protein